MTDTTKKIALGEGVGSLSLHGQASGGGDLSRDVTVPRRTVQVAGRKLSGKAALQ